MILATDMAKHAGDLAAMKEVISQDEVKADRKQLALPAYRVEDEAEKFQKQQFVLECCLHSCDISQGTRSFDVVHKWTYLLFEEFFAQGDLEKDMGLPISMLCDRATTNVSNA